MTDNRESISEEYRAIAKEYGEPDSTIDAGNLFYIADKLHAELTATQQKLDNLKEDYASLDEMSSALSNKLGDNCCACSYDKIEDVCMAHTPKLKATQRKLDAALKVLEYENISVIVFEALEKAENEHNSSNFENSVAHYVREGLKAALASIKE